MPLPTSSTPCLQRNAWIPIDVQGGQLRIHYLDQHPTPHTQSRGTILLIHGFPQTSYQFRHVLTPLANAGYRVIAPDYRGAGDSSHPASGYEKQTMAADLHTLLQHLQVDFPVHIVGQDIGAMIAHAFATSFPNDVISITWGECPLPGSSFYEASKTSIEKFHFIFHCVPDGLPEALVSGREAIYLKQFFDRLIIRTEGISSGDFNHYVEKYAQPDGMRGAFEVYRAFEMDKRRNLEWRETNGRCKVPSLLLSGQLGSHASEARRMGEEFYEDVKTAEVEGSGHYITEENPEDSVAKILCFYDEL
ncbi:hypothetical protein D9758_017556 [Tetrapyrgos nigripes]|uniref:AB hydrolase-1 domain-containing protein n=1 Tax=Tetrapyrgos nigripes TaxID=182062 RepID=A0A8H5C5F3_9AGAR|nr:hypothetical protein D9758_017556 [Tetrapyrgos nigripes]